MCRFCEFFEVHLHKPDIFKNPDGQSAFETHGQQGVGEGPAAAR